MDIEMHPSTGLVESIEQRHAVRSFLHDTIPEVILERIISLALRAPSAYNLQPWRFVVLRSKENKQKLYECAFNQKQIIAAPVVLICCGDRRVNQPEYIEKVIKLGQDQKVITEEAAEIIRQKIPALFENRPCFNDIEAWTNRNTMIAVAYLTIIAQSFGLNSCPMEGFITEKVKAAFNIPEEVDICCLLCLGYTSEPYKKFGGRFAIDEVCYSESFGEKFKI